MKALVTGGAGFIGSNLVRCLLAEGLSVRVLVLPGENTRNLESLAVEKVAGDVLDRASLDRALQDCDWLFHLAALYVLWAPKPERIRQVNVEGARNVLAAALAAGTKRVIFTSSIAVFGGQGRDRDATEASPFAFANTGDLYSVTKYEAHQVALEFAGRGLDLVIAAPCGPIGPGDVGPTPTGRFLVSGFNYPVLPIIDTVNNVVDVRDVARGHLLAAKKGRSGESYLLGNQNLSLEEMLHLAMEIAGVSRPVIKLPYSLARAGAHLMLASSKYFTRKPPIVTPAAVEIAKKCLRADCAKAVTELGLPQTPIRTAMRDALVWFARHGYLKDPQAVKNLVRDN